MTPDPRSVRLPRRPSVLLLAAAAAALAACGGSEGGGVDGGVVVDTVAGVERTLWPGEGGEVLWRGVDTVATLGSIPGGGDGLVLGDVPGASGLAADGEGSLWILDRNDRRIHRYDSTGAREASWGRQGEGPGELERPAGISVGPGDSVWTHDYRLRRVTVFPDGGDDVRTVLPTEKGMFPMARIVPLSDGSHLQQLRSLPSVLGGEGDRTIDLVGRIDPGGTVTDTVAVVARPPRKEVPITSSGDRTLFSMVEEVFAPELRWAGLQGGRVAVVEDAAYRIRVLDASGRELRRFGRRGEPRPVTGADRDAARERRRERADSRADSAAVDRIVEAMTFADVVPEIEALAAAPGGRLWVRTAPTEPGGESEVDVFDSDGRLLGRAVDVPWPHAFVTDRLIARVIRDELDVPRVQLLRLRPEGD